MARSDDLRTSKVQHKPKNVESKRSDKAIHNAMLDCIEYLQNRMTGHLDGYSLEFETRLSYR